MLVNMFKTKIKNQQTYSCPPVACQSNLTVPILKRARSNSINGFFTMHLVARGSEPFTGWLGRIHLDRLISAASRRQLWLHNPVSKGTIFSESDELKWIRLCCHRIQEYEVHSTKNVYRVIQSKLSFDTLIIKVKVDITVVHPVCTGGHNKGNAAVNIDVMSDWKSYDRD